MANNNFDQTVSSLFQGLDHVISTKTVVGEPQVIGDTIILPLVDVSFGMGAGAFSKDNSSNGAGGIGGKMSPSAILVIQNGQTKLVNVRNQDAITKVLDMVPEAVNKVSSIIKGDGKEQDPVVKEAVDEKMKNDSVREDL
ncbi:MAG: GerW family sporulation protein [Clostridiales bacterium]|nr:GerW family sporulation protein [Clostridiales bacterium]